MENMKCIKVMLTDPKTGRTEERTADGILFASIDLEKGGITMSVGAGGHYTLEALVRAHKYLTDSIQTLIMQRLTGLLNDEDPETIRNDMVQ